MLYNSPCEIWFFGSVINLLSQEDSVAQCAVDMLTRSVKMWLPFFCPLSFLFCVIALAPYS